MSGPKGHCESYRGPGTGLLRAGARVSHGEPLRQLVRPSSNPCAPSSARRCLVPIDEPRSLPPSLPIPVPSKTETYSTQSMRSNRGTGSCPAPPPPSPPVLRLRGRYPRSPAHQPNLATGSWNAGPVTQVSEAIELRLGRPTVLPRSRSGWGGVAKI